ncbi:MAG TPA: hypothetical protein VKY65_16135 [Alphaproteobacteria bacterium]|nr:hypothetical protein [Alphaproteobacteria bacterium]
MKLTSAGVERTVSQIGAEAIPENHPALPQLSRIFGNHTFFLDADGLHIVEPVESDRPVSGMGRLVKLASWNDPSQTSLAPHEPEPTGVVIVLGRDGSAS